MRRAAVIVFLVFCVVARTGAAGEEKIRGLLEKTVQAGACAQITDALGDKYFIVKTDQAEKDTANYVGKAGPVVIAGTVETREGAPALYFNLKSVEPYTPKMPSPPPSKAEPKSDAKTGTQPETKPEAKLETKPEAKTEAAPAAKAESKSAAETPKKEDQPAGLPVPPEKK